MTVSTVPVRTSTASRHAPRAWLVAQLPMMAITTELIQLGVSTEPDAAIAGLGHRRDLGGWQ